MRLLDLFCGAGGAAKGYAEAGFKVHGIDIKPQPRYQGNSFQCEDAISWLRGAVKRHESFLPARIFPVIHASPPCQDHSVSKNIHGTPHGTGWMLAETVRLLDRLARQHPGLVWVVENVEGARREMSQLSTKYGFMITLCGTEFGLRVDQANGIRSELRRHRLFLSNMPLWGAGGCQHSPNVITVCGHGNGGSKAQRSYKGFAADARTAMGIDWMRRGELAQAIPPAYTRFIGEQIREWRQRDV